MKSTRTFHNQTTRCWSKRDYPIQQLACYLSFNYYVISYIYFRASPARYSLLVESLQTQHLDLRWRKIFEIFACLRTAPKSAKRSSRFCVWLKLNEAEKSRRRGIESPNSSVPTEVHRYICAPADRPQSIKTSSLLCTRENHHCAINKFGFCASPSSLNPSLCLPLLCRSCGCDSFWNNYINSWCHIIVCSLAKLFYIKGKVCLHQWIRLT